MLELLIVVAIIGILVGILLPSIQASREAARNRSCENNLRQLWLATESYRMIHRVFPAGTIAEKLPVEHFPADNHQNWLLRITPQMSGGANTLAGFDYGRSVYDPVNWNLVTNEAEYLMCNSSPHFSDIPFTAYVGIYDGRDVPLDVDNHGALFANRFLTERDFVDGMQNTVLLGEASPFDNQLGWMSGTIDSLRNLGLPPERSSYSGWNSSGGGFSSTPYGWFKGDRTQDYVQFVDAAFIALMKNGSLTLSASATGAEEKNPTLAEKEEMLAEFDSYFLMESLEEFNELSEDASGGVMASGEDMDENRSSTEEFSDEQQWGMGDEFEDEFGYDYEEQRPILYPVPRTAADRHATAGLSSFHTSGVNVVFVDGQTRLLSWTIDAKLQSELGNRNDGLPYFFE